MALLGDTLLDLKLIESLFKANLSAADNITQFKSSILCNENMAKCAGRLLVPEAMSDINFSTMSIHEKGTSLEAYVGALYEENGYEYNEKVDSTVQALLKELSQAAGVSIKNYSDSNFKGKLLEYFQKNFPDCSRLSSCFTAEELILEDGVTPAFIARFVPDTFDARTSPDSEAVWQKLCDLKSNVCSTKKKAEKNLSEKALALIKSVEKLNSCQ